MNKEFGKVVLTFWGGIKKIETINETNNTKEDVRDDIEEYTELEIKNIITNFKLLKENIYEMILSALRGGSYVYIIVQCLTAVYLSTGVKFIRNGYKTMYED